jgi:uncharacterized protein YhaN
MNTLKMPSNDDNFASDRIQSASIEDRLIALEKRVLGRQRRVQVEQNIIQNLISINNRLSSIMAGKDKLNAVSRQIEVNERYIANPALLDQRTDDYLIKRELVLQNEQRVRQEQQLLQSICAKESIIDSKHINDFDMLTPKLNQLRYAF